jgi:epimerase transport system membrane fusion protein
VLLVTFVGFGGWAALAPLDGAAVAPGQVVVDSQNRVVQHLEGGIVSAIHTNDGERVDEGELLISLSETRPKADLSIVESELDEVLGREARLMAERIGAKKIDFPEVLTSRSDNPDVANIIAGQRELFDSRRQALEGRVAIFGQRIEAFEQQTRGLRSQSKNLESRIASYEEELRNWRELYEEQLADLTRINEMERELFRLMGERDSVQSQIAEIKVRMGETRSELLVTRQDRAEEVARALREAQQSKADLLARQVALRDTLRRTDITAPVSGTVVGMKIHTVGGIVQPGDTLLEVVPTDQDYAINSRVQTQDVDRVRPGQLADVRLSAFNLQNDHVIEGKVARISADAFEDEQSGERYYEARVVITEAGEEVMKEQGMYLMPGMPAEVMIKTGERTVIQYLLDPISRMFARAFREE